MAELRLLAWPAGHSLSPVMHTAALKELGLTHTYRAVAVPPEKLQGAVNGLRSAGVLGANVTVPHKERIMPLLDSVSDAARKVGAVNTVTNSDGRLHGDNTDVHGFLALLESAGVRLAGDGGLSVVVLGAGGAARAAVYGLAGHARLTVINRTVARAEALAAAFPQVEAVAPAASEELLEEADVLVNTTSVGMELEGRDPDESPLPPGVLPARAVVVDMVYRPERTRLLRDAATAGLPAFGGLEMLVQQGAASLRLWTGLADVPVSAMRSAARAALSGD